MAESTLQYLRSQFLEFLSTPPRVGKIIFEWPVDRERPREIIESHPERGGGWWGGTALYRPPSALIHDGWAWEVETAVELGGLQVSKQRRGIYDDLNKKACDELERCEASCWYGKRDVLHSLRLTAEVVHRVQPRRMIRVFNSRVSSILHWENWMEVLADGPHCRAWLIDNFAKDAAEALRRLEHSYDHLGVDQDANIPIEHRTRTLTKAEAARLHSPQTVTNPTKYFNDLIDKKLLTPPVGSGRSWQFDVREFPANVRSKLRETNRT